MPPFLLALLLFWQKRQMNIMVMVHIVIIMALYSRAFFFQPYDWSGNNSPEMNTALFNYIYNATLDTAFCFIFFRLYEWWYIGKRRSELNFE